MSFTREEKLAITAVVLAALIGLGVMLYSMGIIEFSGGGMTGAATGTNLPPEFTASSAKFVTKQNVPVQLSLGDIFKDPEGLSLTFVATNTEGLVVDLNEDKLTITPEPGFTGERVVTVFASDGSQVARKQLKIEVTGYNVAKKPEPTPEPEPLPPAPEPAPETTPPAPETVPSPANATNASNETLPAPEQAPAQTEQPAVELPILLPATEQIAVQQRNIPKVEHEVEERLSNESEITAIVYFNESAVNEAGLIVVQDSKDQRENWLAKKRAKVKAARELLLANLTPSGFTTSERGFEIVRQYETINAIAVKLTKSGLAKLNQSPNVLNIYSEKVLHIMLNQSVPLINAEDIWNMTLNNTKLNGMGVAVCIIDTGIDFGNPAFVNENAKIFGGYDFVNMDDHPQDDNGHGTHCAGIVGGNMTGGMGVSPNIGIVPVKVCDSGGSCPDVAVLAGIDYCIDHSAEFNISTISGSIGSGTTYNSANCPADSDAAFLIALAAGVTPVFAAGNWGVRPGVSWPSCSQYAISVGNVNKSNVISVSSNYGGDRFDVWAPGSNIYSAALGGGVVAMSGTSMATPHMAAVIAMIQYNLRLQSKPILSITQMHELLNTTGLVISDWRRIDVYAAILKLNANLTMNQSDNSITNVTANTTLQFKNDTNFDGFIQCGAISYNYVSIDSSLCPNLNKTAHIIFGNLSFVNATPTRNGQRCRPPICQNATYANGMLEFDVTEFSSYSSTEGNVYMDLIKLDSQDPVNASSYLNYTILINVTQGNASNITLTDLYPEQLIYLDSQPLPVPPTNNTFVIGNFTENQSILVNISMFVLNVSNNTQINNTANVSFQNDTSSWINASVSESTIILNQPLWNFTNISVNKTDSIDPVNASDYLNYTINMTLTGNGSAYNVTVNDTYPSQVIYQSAQPAPLAGTNNTWNWTSISSGASLLINITVFTRNVSNGTILNNTVNVTCVNDTAGVMNFFSYAETTISSVFNVTNTSMLKIHSPDPINASSVFNYTINFTNTGTAVIYSLKINDTYPTPLSYISAQPSPDPGTNNYWTLGTFVPNATIIINISMSVPNLANGVMLNNTANATYQNDIGDIIPLTAQDNTPVNNPPNSCPVTINSSTTLNSNLNSGTSCITIGGNNLVLDCAGYQVTYNTGGGNSDYGIGADRKSNITIQNCAIIDNIGTGSYISGINFTKVNSSLIRNTVINSTGSSYTFGISLRDRDQNVTVTNVTIKTRGSSTYNFGVQMFNSTGNIIANSTILANSTSGSEVYGVLIDDYSQNNTVDNSTITADGTSNYNTGVYLRYTVSNNIVSGNTIKALSTATLAYSVYLNSNNYQMSQNKIINNNISVNCSSTCYGVYVLYSSTNGIIENNTVNSAGRGSGNTNYGIFLWSSGGGGPGNYTIKNNTVRTYGIGDLNHGIHIWGNWNAINNSVINNNVFPSGTGRANIAIYLIGASSTRVIGNNISTYGTQENHGIYVSSGSAACLIANNTVVANGSAGYNYGLLAVAGGDNSTFADNNVTVRGIDSTGIYSETSQGNYFLNNQVNTSGSDGLMVLGDNIVYFATNSIATTNTINGTPIYYYGGAGSSPACPNNQVLNSPNTNHIDFIGCNNVTLSNYAGSEGILLANNSNSTINYTVIRNTRYPVRLLFNSSYNNITYSNLTANHSSGGYGVWIAYSAGNNLVSASNITTIGLATDNNYGVYIAYNSSNNTITNSHISTNGSNYNYGVYLTLNANDNTVSNNLIRTKGSVQQNKGVYLYSYASGNSITNNTIITNGTNYDDGIHVYSYSNNNRLENNTINADGIDYVYGINVQTNSQNNTVKGNNITIYTPTTNIQTANGIYLQDLATKTTVDKNSILMYTYAMFNIEKNHGIYLINAHNNTITNNRVDTKGLYDFHLGIYLSTYSSNNLIENNTVITGGRNYNHGIVTIGMYSYSPCNNNTIKNNTILVNGTSGINYGIYEYQYNNKNDILNNRIVTNCTYSCEGIRFEISGSNAMIANNTVIASGTSPGTDSTSNYGIYMYAGSNNNVMADNNISTTNRGSHGVLLIGSSNETLHNNNITIPALAQGLYIDVLDGSGIVPDVSQFMHTIDTQNTINGTPIYYYGGLGDSPACPNNQVLNSPNSNHIDFIGCNNATLNGFTAFEPVTIVNATNSTINNSRISNAYVGVRLFFNSTYNTISNCNITSENTTGSNYGILMHYWSSNNTIKNNNISVISGTTGNYGIYLFNSSKENNITNNFIFVNGTSTNYGVYIQKSSSRNLVDSNNVRLKGTSNTNYGVYIYQSSEGNTIRNSTINTNSTGGASTQGVVLDNYASNNTVTGCTILGWNIYGLYVTTTSNNNTISYNNILLNNTNAGSAYCVYLNGPFSGTQVVGNNITSNCSQNCYGLNVYNTVQNGIIANNTIRTIGGNANNHGIYLNYEDTNNNISGNRINAMGRGIWIQTASQPNRFNDNNITAIGDYAVYLQSATGSLFNNTFFDNSTYWLNSDASSRNNFTNTAFGTALARITILPIIQLNTTTIQWSQINSSFNKTYINSTALPYFNTSGLVTLNGLTGSVASALVDYNDDNVYEDCPADQCVQQSFSGGTVVYNVTHFTGYSANTSEGPLVITSCPATINSTYTLTQNLASNDTCITIGNSSMVFDCAGFNISYNANGSNNENGIFAVNVTNITIKNCNIRDINSTGARGLGINLTNVTNSSIINNTIQTNGTNSSIGIRMYALSANNLIANNTINVFGYTAAYGAGDIAEDGIMGYYGNRIIGNVIRINSSVGGCDGISLAGNNSIINNTIILNENLDAGASSGIRIYGSNNLVSNNSIVSRSTTTSGNVGILAYGTTNNYTISGNVIRTNGTNSNFGIALTAGGSSFTNYTIIDNVIFTAGSDSDNYGLSISVTALGGADNYLIAGNRINTSGTSANYGILASKMRYAIVENNTIRAHVLQSESATSNIGISLTDCSNNNFTRNTIFANGSTGGAGIYITHSTETAQNNTFNHTNITTQATSDYEGFAIQISSITNANGTKFDNTFLANPREWMWAGGADYQVNFTNTTFNMPNGTIRIPGLFQLNYSGWFITQDSLNITFNKAFLNSASLGLLNTSAEITLNGIAFSDPMPMVDYTDTGSYIACPTSQCTELSYTPGVQYVFNTTHFTSYSTQEGPTAISGCPVTINESTTLTQDLITFTNKSCITMNRSNITLDCASHTILYATNGTNNTYGVFAYKQNNLTVKDCVIMSVNSSLSYSSAINFTNVTNILIQNNTIVTNGTRDNHGFFARYSSNVTVINNTISAGTTHENYGIIAANSDKGLIANNTVRSCCGNTATGLFGQTNFTITNNAVNVTGASSSAGITVGNENWVENNTVEVHALNVNSGITTSDRVTVRNNTIYINGTSDNIGVNANNRDLVVMNNITVIGTSYCYALSGDSGNVFENNTARLFASGHDNAGVYDNYNNVIKNNSIIMNGTYANEGMRTRDNSTIIGNTLTISHATSDNVIIYAYSETTLQYNNFVLNGSGSTNIGLEISYNDNFPPVIGNNVSISGSDTTTGIYASSQTNLTVLGNNVTVTATSANNYGINLDDSVASANIEYNKITASGADQTYGIALTGTITSENNITGNNITVSEGGYDSAALALTTTGTITGQRVINNNINITASGGSGIFLGNATTNTLTGNNVTSTNGYAVFIVGGGANSFANTSLTDPMDWLFVGSGSSGNTFIRTLFAQYHGSIFIVPSVMPDNTDATKARLNITYNLAFMNSTNLQTLNTSAIITLNGIALSDPRPMVDYEDDATYIPCPADQCTELSYTPGVQYVFNTTHFTGYTLDETPGVQYNFTNISIIKTDYPDPVNASSYLNYTITINSSGNGTAYGVWVNDTYPLQVIYQSSQPAPIMGTNNSWMLSTMPNGTVIQINITVFVLNVTDGTVINNTANVTYQNETTATLRGFANQSTIVLNPPPIFNFTNISITKTDYPDPVNISSYLNYTINVSITGNGTAYNVTVNETYPPQVIYISSQPAPVAGTNNSWVLGNLTATNITINITVLVQNITNNTLINNTANATCTNETLALLRASDTENTTVLAPPVPPTYNFTNMTIRKMDNPDPVNASSNLTYQINVSSTGNGTAYNVTVNDTYPPQAIYLTSQPTPKAGTNNSWLLGNLTAGTNVSVNVTLLVLNITNGTIINNTANVTFQNETGAAITYGNFAETLVLNPPRFNLSNITVTKAGVPNPVAPGGQLNYTITVTSNGNGTAYNVTINDTYPEQVIYLSSQPTPFAGTNNSWEIGNLPPGTVVLLNITVNVSESTANGTVINNTVNLTFNNETGALLGRNADTSTNVSNVTPTPTPPGPSGGGGGSGGGGIGGVRRNTTTAPVQQGCVENWECGEWTACVDNSQSRSCIEANGCTNPQFAPQTQRSCQPQKPAQEERPAELPSEIQHSGLPEQQPLEFPEEKSGISISSIKTSISAIAKPIINLFKAYLWPIIFIIIALLLLTAGYVVFTHRREDEGMQQIPMPGLQMPEEMPEPRMPPALSEPRMPKARPEPRIPEARSEPMMPARLILPRIGQLKQQKSDKKFYTGIDAKLADINKKLASLDKTNKKLEKKLKKR